MNSRQVPSLCYPGYSRVQVRVSVRLSMPPTDIHTLQTSQSRSWPILEQLRQTLMEGSPDIFALGFQEIVPLTAQQIVQADPDKRSALEVLEAIFGLLKGL